MKPRIFLTGSTSFLGTKFVELYGDTFDILGVARSDKANSVDLLVFDKLRKLFVDFRPDFVVHLAADVGRDTTTQNEIIVTNPAITKNLIELALINRTPFIFTSTEAVYGGKEQEGGYKEADAYKPRSPYGISKVTSEELLIASGLPYLITRGHRYVGISKNFSKPKQFPDTLKAIKAGQEVHLDSRKLFKPVLINHLCAIFNHYITNDQNKQILVNVGTDCSTTYHGLISDVAKILELDTQLIKADGEEAGWAMNSTLSLAKLEELGYPLLSYEQMLETIKFDSKV